MWGNKGCLGRVVRGWQGQGGTWAAPVGTSNCSHLRQEAQGRGPQPGVGDRGHCRCHGSPAPGSKPLSTGPVSVLQDDPGGPSQNLGVVGSHTVQVRGRQQRTTPQGLVSRTASAVLHCWLLVSKSDKPGHSFKGTLRLSTWTYCPCTK